jgi:uncharacterized protein (DUF488 family)
MPKTTLYTLGYQGLDIQTYISILNSAGVGTVLDVREKAWSRKRGFAKSALKEALESADIEYLHLPSAGNPSSNRNTAKDMAECLARYRDHLTTSNSCIYELIPLIITANKSGRPACLTCYEASPEDCHRSILIDFIELEHPKINVIHLSDSYLPPQQQIPGPLRIPQAYYGE